MTHCSLWLIAAPVSLQAPTCMPAGAPLLLLLQLLQLPDWDAATTAVLFPKGPNTPSLGSSSCPVLRTLVVLESNWHKARVLLQHPQLARLPRVQLPPEACYESGALRLVPCLLQLQLGLISIQFLIKSRSGADGACRLFSQHATCTWQLHCVLPGDSNCAVQCCAVLCKLNFAPCPPNNGRPPEFTWRRGDGSFRGSVEGGMSSIEAIHRCCRSAVLGWRHMLWYCPLPELEPAGMIEGAICSSALHRSALPAWPASCSNCLLVMPLLSGANALLQHACCLC